MKIPGFISEASLTINERYSSSTRFSGNQETTVIIQSRRTCAFKAGRLAGRCLGLGYSHGDCMELAADFYGFCNQHDL
jgi:hypothetical protein